ncbi:MAG TPA: RNA polymerase subunit sigma-24 [Ruminococcaceae bacterium]|nr:RNA polymerase subunit sigma-24 [Oscillospiraceae bacterium]
MTTVNLRDFYPWYKHDELMEVPDEVAAVLAESIRLERNYSERVRYNKAYYSLDTGDGIEREACYINMSPHEIYEHEFLRCRVCQALNSLSEPQGRRVEAFYILGMKKAHIAQAEGVDEKNVRKSIKLGVQTMREFLKKYF